MTTWNHTAADHSEFEIDIGRALDLLGAAVERAAEFGPRCLVAAALALAGVGERELRALHDRDVRDLYAAAAFPVSVTLGALMVFDAAQRSQGRGSSWGDALEQATAVALDYLKIAPERMLASTSRQYTGS
jgi:hypothetical protein